MYRIHHCFLSAYSFQDISRGDVGKSKHGQYQEESGDEKTLQSYDQGEGACGVLSKDELFGRSVDDENLLSYEKNSKSIAEGLLEITERTELVKLDDR